MSNEVLRLKTDILKSLREDRYYVSDELQRTVDSNVEYKKKVKKLKSLLKKLFIIDNQINLTEAVFVINEQNSNPVENVIPDNVVEHNQQTSINQQGQSHSE